MTLCILTVILSVLLVAMALLSRFVIDAALGAADSLLFWGGVFVADVLAIVLLHTLLSWYTASTADSVNASMRKRILRTAVYSREESLLEHHSGELLNRSMEDVHTLCDGAIVALPGLVGQLTRLVAAFAAVCIISPEVAMVLLAGALVIGVGTACVRPALKKLHRAVRNSDEQVMAVMQEDLQQSELIRNRFWVGLEKYCSKICVCASIDAFGRQAATELSIQPLSSAQALCFCGAQAALQQARLATVH